MKSLVLVHRLLVQGLLLSDLQGDDKEQTERNWWTNISGFEKFEGVKVEKEFHFEDLWWGFLWTGQTCHIVSV